MNITDIHRYLSGEATAEERKSLERWLEESEKNRELFESYRKIYDIEIPYKYEYDTEKALNRFREVMNKEKVVRSAAIHRISRTPQQRKAGIWWKAAAILLVAAGLSVYIYTSGLLQSGEVYDEEIAGTTITSNSGEQKSFRLRDGSRVRLNADSELYIPENFGEGKREVHLAGEAFFEVVRANGLGFEVHTGSARIEVLGTSFGVRAWKERDESVVAVQSGNVSVRSSDDLIPETTQLEAGQFSKIEVNNAPTPALDADIDQYIGWIHQKFVFEETPLRDVLKQLELHFNVTITVDDSSTINDPVTARYRNESLEEILEYTSITHGVNFEVDHP